MSRVVKRIAGAFSVVGAGVSSVVARKSGTSSKVGAMSGIRAGTSSLRMKRSSVEAGLSSIVADGNAGAFSVKE